MFIHSNFQIRISSFPNPSKAMSFLCYKHLLFSYLLINFTFINQLVQPQTLIAPNFDESFLPFGSQAIQATFSARCNRDESDGATFTLLNNCSFTLWPAAIPGGGRRLDSGEAWILNVPFGTTGGRVWGRTNCSFHSSGRGKCETGDCGGVLQCRTFGSPPNTLAEFSLNQFNNLDFFDVSLVDGFNIPIEFGPRTSNGCSSKGVRCAGDINGQCPAELRVAGGCNSPCAVFKTDEYCCNKGRCGPTEYSKFFKDRCPDAYSYPTDDETSTFTCPGVGGSNYDVVFCPS